MNAVVTKQTLPTSIVSAINHPDRLRQRPIDLLAYANDASHYALTPKAVIIAENTEEISAVLRAASSSGESVTFRSGGTSLSGQAVTDGILVDSRRSFREITVLDDGHRVRVQPGATVRQVNTRLMRYGRRLGPDPASESACTIGGVIANNSSGMACGIEENTYRTLESAVLVLASGTIFDTSDPRADEILSQREPELVVGLLELARRVRSNTASLRTIERHFALKNTLGYGLNSFLDYESPSQLLLHLVIGSEGTLAFVAEATFRTVPLRSHTTTALALFSNLKNAADSLPDLVGSGAATLELMDSTSLRVGQGLANVPESILGFEVRDQAALLIEYQAPSAEELAELWAAGQHTINTLNTLSPVTLSTDAAARRAVWSFRKGLYASVAGARASGTTALLEDIAVPVEHLSETCETLQDLFEEAGYKDSVIFGHAKDGNIHFMLTDRFEDDAALNRLSWFTDNMAKAVLASHGNLKAEHGTGRAMAPYVRLQYGDELYEVMESLKRLLDPANILNPGVIINANSQAHLNDIKLTPTVEEEVDRCVECGYCEPVCPSRDLTLTPRQRIVVRRAHADALAADDAILATSLEQDYAYDGVQTCAVDSMCQVACPLGINTGSLVKTLRAESQGPIASAWNAAAMSWGVVSRAGSLALSVADRAPATLVRGATNAARKVIGAEHLPQYEGTLPSGGANRRRLRGVIGAPGKKPKAIYLPACVNSMFGPEPGGLGATDSFVALLERSGVAVVVPDTIEGLCCGTPWASKGITAGVERMRRALQEAIFDLSEHGRLPIISDATSCTEGFAHSLTGRGFQVEDAMTFTVREVLPHLNPVVVSDALALHPTCSSVQLDINEDLQTLGEAVASSVFIPDSWGCCGFAGDRGMLHPELTAAATKREAAEVLAANTDSFASCNRTCEIGMSRATERPYHHVFELLELATR